jgi:heptosyltransferase II
MNLHPNIASERILIRGLNWLGDAIMSTPALQRLREARPAAHIALLTPSKLAGLWNNYPHLDEVISFSPGESVFQVGARLRAGNFQIGFAFPNSPRSALELRLARIPRRIGYARPWRNFFLSQVIQPPGEHVTMRKRTLREIRRSLEGNGPIRETYPPGAHHVHHYLKLVAAAGANPAPIAPHLPVWEEDTSVVLKRFGIPAQGPPLLGLNPGAEYGPAKRWPAENFASAAATLIRELNARWVVVGGPSDRELASSICNMIAARLQASGSPEVWNLAGQTTLRELASVFRGCSVVLTNDTGPMHLAAAVGTPVVVPFGSTSPELTGPGLPGEGRHQLLKSQAACSPCFLRECPIDFRCMREMNVERVVTAVLAILRP